MQQGGSQYGVPPPEMTPFTPPGTTGPRPHMLGVVSTSEHLQQQQQLAEAASPISSRPPPPPPSSMSRPPNFTELAPAMTGSFTDEDALAAGEEAERGGVPGNRWPRQETLALLKIRSEMDVVFRDATLKGPLWEDVSRKLAELGYIRSAKKCKEKFENVHKYYKRTKDGRAGRQDGKSYRFFTQLEALHSSSAPIPTTLPALTVAATTPPPNLSPTSIATTSMAGSSARIQPLPVSPAAPPPITIAPPRMIPDLTTAAPVGISGSATAAAAGISFSSSTSSSSSDESDGDETEEGLNREGRKRKREDGSGGSRKMMVFFEGLMKQVMERQEAMQQRFLETIEKREQDRMIREEAWKRQEMSRLAREHELMAQERALTASRDAAVIAFLQKLTGQTIQLPPAVTIPAAPPPSPPPQQQQPPPQQPQQPAPPPPPPPPQQPPQPQQHHHHHQSTEIVRHQPSPSSELVPIVDPQEMVGSGSFDMASSRWPKTEVLALIKLRSGLESRYQEAGPKGPLWEEISAGMQRLGYNRSSKRCKEKWENINKYFKKVKESKKKRPEDAKTCPYFHELDALYRRKLGGSSSSSGIQRQLEQEANPNPNPRETSDIVAIMAPPPPLQQPLAETENKNSNINNNRNGGNPESGGGGSGGVVQIQTSNGGLPPSFFEEGTSGSTAMKKKTL